MEYQETENVDAECLDNDVYQDDGRAGSEVVMLYYSLFMKAAYKLKPALI